MQFILTKQKHKNILTVLGFVFIFATVLFFQQSIVHAAAQVDVPVMYAAENSGACSDINNCEFIDKFVNPVIKFLTAGVGIVITMMIIIGGIQYSSAGDDPQKVGAAKKKISNAILALVLFIALSAILNWLVPGGLL